MRELKKYGWLLLSILLAIWASPLFAKNLSADQARSEYTNPHYGGNQAVLVVGVQEAFSYDLYNKVAEYQLPERSIANEVAYESWR